METLKLVLKSAKFWVAIFGLAQTILFQFVPDFPPAIWQAIDALVIVVVGTLVVDDVHKLRQDVNGINKDQPSP